MATIDDIRVNGQQATTATPVVPTIIPVITWDFIEDAAAPSQASFELRIGTSSTSHGLDLFVGNITDINRDETANVYEHLEHDLARGQKYFGQIRVTDPDGDKTVWATFTFKVNQLSFVTQFTLSPSSPTTAQNLDLAYTYHDPDNHSESGTKIRWFKNNVPQAAYNDTCTLPAAATAPGESWTAKIIPSDGLEFGPVVETLAVTISSIDVGFDNIKILPADANVDDILKVEFDLADNEYVSFTGVIVIEWYINGVLVPDSNQVFIRLSLSPGDIVHVVVKITDNGAVLSQGRSLDLIIADVPWYIFDLTVSGLVETDDLTDLAPTLEWKRHQTTSSQNDVPAFLQVKVSTTPSLDEPIFDSGVIEYLKNSFVMPSGVLGRGQRYFIHVGASDDATMPDERFITKEIRTAGSSWALNVKNTTGWTIEFKLAIFPDLPIEEDPPETANMGVYIHDGTYFCAISFGLRTITLLSDTPTIYKYPDDEPSLRNAKAFKIIARGQTIKIFMNNKLVLNEKTGLTKLSNLKTIVYGDIDTKNVNNGTFRFFRYSTDGAFGFGDSLPDENKFLFTKIGKLEGGDIEFIFDNLISWLPDDTSESTRLIQFNENSRDVRFPTVSRNFSPITTIYVDENRNKFIGTANGVTAIYGDKHDPDFQLKTDDKDVQIKAEDFDRISTVSKSLLSAVEPDIRDKWFTIDTTYRAVGQVDNSIQTPVDDEYNPYLAGIKAHAIHYYSQRTHGHAWYDKADNDKGWQIKFSFKLDTLEADDFTEENLEKHGFGVYINDGVYQEILYFYDDRIRLFYANVFVPINTLTDRDFVISGQGNNILVYQKLTNAPVGSHQLLIDGSGLFTTPGGKTGNSRKPKIVLGSDGVYHAVWHDDGNHRSQIFYSTFDGSSWSNPELVTQSIQFNLRNPDIDVDSLGNAWVVYEDTSWGNPEIVVSVRDAAGWNPRTRITNAPNEKGRPAIKVDNSDNVHLVWEDKRNGRWEIFWAEWQNDKRAWISSAQFGKDTPIMQTNNDDPYHAGNAVDFRKASLGVLDERLWVVAEGHFDETSSVIYRGYRDLDIKIWVSSGALVTDDDSAISGLGTIVSPINRNCFNPTIATNEAKGLIVIAWEDRTEPISQIWGNVLSRLGLEVTGPIQITNQTDDSKTPSAGWVSNHCVIVFEKNGGLYLVYFDGNFSTFFGSSTGGNDRIIQLAGKAATNPSVPPFTAAKSFVMLYDFKKDRDPYTVSTVEFPDFQLIGDASVEHQESSSGSVVTTTTTLNDGVVNNIDTREFAFGDFSENVGMVAHWRDIEMYFGYNARPHSIARFNSNTVSNWPDDRVSDLFVDVFGNVIASTFGGLVYHNVRLGDATIIDGHTEAFDSEVGCTAETCLLKGKLITSVAWGGNGIWYVGTTQGAFYSDTAGRTWFPLAEAELSDKIINTIAVNARGEAVLGTSSDGVFIAHPNITTIRVQTPDLNVRTVAVDENDIIWAGSDTGLFRIENLSNILSFGRNQGMRSSHVNDIAIVNKHLRYIATATGVERMNGMKFTNFNVHTHEILNDNIASLQWVDSTQSLWVGSLYQLHEIIFRDPAHDIIEDEVVQYNSLEISTEQVFDRDIYFVLDFSLIQPDPDNPLRLTSESALVFINKNPIGFGFTVDETGQSVQFLTDLLVDDQVEIEISNKFIQFHDFTQTAIEKDVLGEKRTNIAKLDRTSRNQLVLLSDTDKHGILLFAGETRLPFTTILLDRDLPVGCLEKLATITSTTLRFRILAFDLLSGLDGYILSNFENFTSDGETALEFTPFTNSIVEHNIGKGLTNVIDSLVFPSTVTIDTTEYSVGTGTALGSFVDEVTTTTHLYAGTSRPPIIFRYDPVEDKWTALQNLDPTDDNRVINQIETINNVLWVATGTSSPGGSGGLYRSTDGLTFDVITSVTGDHVRGIAGAADGTVFFGSSDGKIYTYKDGSITIRYQNIGSSVYSLSLFANILVVATGDQGRIFSIDTETNSNLIIFDGSEKFIREVHVKDADIITSADQAILFAGSGETTTIYRATLDTFDFIKSYSSFNKTVRRIKGVESVALVDPGSAAGVEGTTTVAIVGTDLFKHVIPAWEFFYQHDEEIADFLQYSSAGVEGIWVISENKVTKWTGILSKKTVFLRLKDKAGNISRLPDVSPEALCPTETVEICCDYAYSINIADLQGFVNEARLVDVTEYGVIEFTYDSPNSRSFFGGDQIDEEIGIYQSEVFNGSNELISWNTISWVTTEPSGTSVIFQIRSGVTEDDTKESDWSANLVPDSLKTVAIEFITNQYIQFRVFLRSAVRDLSPTLTSVTLRNITALASHFFTTNFVLPSRPIKGLLTSNSFIPVSSDVVFGFSTKNSVDFGDYQIIEPNRIFSSSQGQFGSNFRIGAKLLSPGIAQLSATNQPGDPYDSTSFVCEIKFTYENIDSQSNTYHFRIRLYNDPFRTQLIHTFYTGNDQSGWTIGDNIENVYPSGGLTIGSGESKIISFLPGSQVEGDQKFFVTIDAFNGSFFETVSDNKSYLCVSCQLVNELGVIGEYYTGFSSLAAVPDFSILDPAHVTIDTTINFAFTSGAWITTQGVSLGSEFIDKFAARWRGRILTPTTGSYTFTLNSDDGGLLFIDRAEIINNDGFPASTSKSGSVTLSAGFHDVEVQFFANLGPNGVQLRWTIPGETTEVAVPANRFFHTVASEYCDIQDIPKILNFAVVFELENGETVKVNLNA